MTKVRLHEFFLIREDWQCSFPLIFRGTVLVFLIGLIPGPAATISRFASYFVQRPISAMFLVFTLVILVAPGYGTT